MTTTGSWWVYILRCADDTFYVGLARHLAARVRQHNGADRRGARYTRGRRPVILYLAQPCADRRTAAQLEWQTKQLPRQRKVALMGMAEWLSGEEALRQEAHMLNAVSRQADDSQAVDPGSDLS